MVKSNDLFSPKEVARAIGVSESSLKRWCDSGKISAMKTAGGHRRLAHSDIISFLRKQNISLQNPEAVGLPMFDSQLVANTAKAQHRLLETLTNDSESECRDLLVHLFVNQWPLERIVDDVIAPVFRQIGYLWEQKQLDTYRQRRACQICLAALHEIRLFLPDPPANAPKAICASIAGDHYSLPAMAVELTLVADGWNAASLGSDLPLESFLQAARLEKPALACMSISHIDSESELMSSLNHFAANLPPSVTLVIGGSAITSTLRNGLKSVICCDNMSQLLAIASSLNPLTED